MHRKNTARVICGVLSVGVLFSAALHVSAEPEETAAPPAETTAVTEQTAPPPAETTSVQPETTVTTTTTETTTTETTTTTSETTTTAPHSAVGSMEYEELPDGTLRITRFKWFDEKTVTIPDEIGGKPVTEIGKRAFQYCYADEVIFPASLRSIGDEAFAGNAYLLHETIPAGCTSIGSRAFAECELLDTVTIPDSVRYIGYLAFDATPFFRAQQGDFVVLGDGVLYAYQGSGSDVTIPETVKVIAPYALSNHGDMRSVTIPASVTDIWDGAFDNCPALKTVNAPATFDYVDGAAFANTAFYNDFKGDFLTLGDYLLRYAGKGTEVHVPDGIRVLNDSALEGNTAVTTLILPDSVERVGRAACYGCTSLQVVTLGDKVQKIGDMAFWGCETLRYLRVGHHLTDLGAYAFAGCKALDKIYLPDTLTAIGEKALGYTWNQDSSAYSKLSTPLTVYANAEAAVRYAQAEGLTVEPLPEAENTEPIPDVTTLSQTGIKGIMTGSAWIPAAALGGVLVLIGIITFAVRRRKKQ